MTNQLSRTGGESGLARQEARGVLQEQPSAAQHTPGPWEIYTGKKLEYWRGDGTEIMGPDGRVADSYCNSLRRLDECQANARLIAAAPDLLETLRAIAPLLGRLGVNNDEAWGAFSRVIATITKAEGLAEGPPSEASTPNSALTDHKG